MKQILKYLIVIVTIVLLSGCTKQPTKKLPNQVYTQVGMWYLDKEIEICTNKDIMQKDECIEQGKSIPSVNYSRDHFIPVNTHVTIIDENRDNIIAFKYNKQNFVIDDRRRGYTGLSEYELRKKLFSTTKVDLSKFRKKEQSYIKEGEVHLNMSKEAIILSRGYPPIHRTPSLKSNVWRYWEGRFNSRNYIFENNRLVRIDD